jgi:hypothetical protein
MMIADYRVEICLQTATKTNRLICHSEGATQFPKQQTSIARLRNLYCEHRGAASLHKTYPVGIFFFLRVLVASRRIVPRQPIDTAPACLYNRSNIHIHDPGAVVVTQRSPERRAPAESPSSSTTTKSPGSLPKNWRIHNNGCSY